MSAARIADYLRQRRIHRRLREDKGIGPSGWLKPRAIKYGYNERWTITLDGYFVALHLGWMNQQYVVWASPVAIYVPEDVRYRTFATLAPARKWFAALPAILALHLK